MPKNNINYTTSMATRFGNNCPLRGSCRRFELYVIWQKANLNNLVFFTIEQYDQKTNKCKLYIPIEQ